MLISTVEPLRRFQVDTNLKKKLILLRNFVESNRSNVKNGKIGLGIYSFPMNIPIHLAKNFLDLQKMLFKYNESLYKEIQFVDFWYGSRQIFQFDPFLSEALSITNVDDVPWEKIILPFDNMYLSFGKYNNNEFEVLGSGYKYKIDGAYVKVIKPNESLIFNEGALMIEFTSSLIEPSYEVVIDNSMNGLIFSEPTYPFILSGKLGETVKDAIAKGEETYLSYCDALDSTNYEQSFSLLKELTISDSEDTKLNLSREKYFRGKEIILSFLSPLLNCILYLSQYPENVKSKYNSHKSKMLFKKLSRIQIDNNERKELNKVILNNDYSRIKFVSDFRIVNKSYLPSSKEMKPHWRRGHWRNQAFGNDLSKHKYIWIHPTIVNKSKGLPESGHLYDVEISQ